MADIAVPSAEHPHASTPSPQHRTARPYQASSAARSPLNWVRRRARRLQNFYAISRREAVDNAWQDWGMLHPRAVAPSNTAQ